MLDQERILSVGDGSVFLLRKSQRNPLRFKRDRAKGNLQIVILVAGSDLAGEMLKL